MDSPTTLQSQPETGGLFWSTLLRFSPQPVTKTSWFFNRSIISSTDLSFPCMLALPYFKHGQIQKLSLLFNGKTLTRTRIIEKEGDYFIWKLEEIWTHIEERIPHFILSQKELWVLETFLTYILQIVSRTFWLVFHQLLFHFIEMLIIYWKLYIIRKQGSHIVRYIFWLVMVMMENRINTNFWIVVL